MRDVNAELEYPRIAQELKLKGVVFILVRISRNGNITWASVLRGFDPSCNEEALRIVKGLDFWMPAQHRNKVVTSEMVVPVEFGAKKKSALAFLLPSIAQEGFRVFGALLP